MTPRPDILLITVDSLRADRLGCYGYQRPTSPRIDEFAQGCTLFQNGFANGPNTPHAFPAIMASRSALASSRLGLFDAPLTLAECLRKQGYRTIAFNAANPYVSKAFDYHRGFDEFLDYLDLDIEQLRAVSASGKNVQVARLDLEHYLVSEESVRRKAILEDRFNQEVVDCLDGLNESPFFLWVHYMDTHYPYVPQPGAQKALQQPVLPRDENLGINQRVRENAEMSSDMLAKLNSLYDAAIRQLDAKVGQLLDRLKETGKYDETVILFTADHGEEFHDHGDLQHKSKLFEELIHVPLLLKLPGQRLQETRRDLVSHLQIAPSILAAAGIEHGFKHRNFLTETDLKLIFSAASYGKDNGTPVDRDMFRIDRMPRRYCVRSPQWKLVTDSAAGELLLNLMQDPAELSDVSAQHPVQACELRAVSSEFRAYLETVAVQARVSSLRKALVQQPAPTSGSHLT